jgi:aspartate-semialdehyde dehydrogenase
MRLAIVGITGLVGQLVLRVLGEFDFQLEELIPVASDRSIGREIEYQGKAYAITNLKEAVQMVPDVAIFSAGGNVSLEWAPKFAKVGCVVVDNSSAWRMNPDNKLIVPEINSDQLTKEDKIIANPNCSTIQLVMALAPLHKVFKIKRLVVSTYQSFTGTGAIAVRQYQKEKDELIDEGPSAYPYQIFENAIPHCDVFLENSYTKEEVKVVNETRKILGDESLRITCTAVRIPVFGGHSESVNVEFEKPFELNEVVRLLQEFDGVTVLDDIKKNLYPMPLYAHGKNDVFVGRIRKDYSAENAINMWVVADNLRKGAATNAVQIVKYLSDNGILKD